MAVGRSGTYRGLADSYLPLGTVPEGTSLEEVRNKWQSDAMDLVGETAPIVVDGSVAVCDGGTTLGHKKS